MDVARLRSLAIVTLAYSGAVYAIVTLAREPDAIAMVRPANALALGGMIALRGRCGLLEIAALGLANALVHLGQGDPKAASLAIGLGNAIDIGVTRWLLGLAGVTCDQPNRLRAIVGLFFVSLFGPIAGALVGGAGGAVGRSLDPATAICSWWMLSAVSYLTLLPPFLFWRSREERDSAREYRLRTAGETSQRVRLAELYAAAAALTFAGLLVPATGHLVLIELSATMLLWFGLRFGMFATALAAAIFSGCVVTAALIGYWPGAAATSRAAILLPLQATLALTTLPALLVAAIMSQRERVRRSLRADALRLSYALEGANDGLWDWHLPSGESFFSARACRMFGYEPEDFLAKSRWDDLVHPDDLAPAKAAFDAHARGETLFYEAELRCRHRDGRWIWLHDRGKVVERGPRGEAIRAVGTYSDVSERKNLENALEHLATHDALTGLANRGVFERGLQREASRAERHGGRLAVLLVDVDHFKAVNDTYGHAAGDALLVTLATRLRNAVRVGDLAARLGGDEFGIVASGQSAQEFDVLAERLCAALAEPLEGPGYSISSSVSIGVAVAAGGGVEDLTLRADRALYAAKSAGRGTWRFFGGADKVA